MAVFLSDRPPARLTIDEAGVATVEQEAGRASPPVTLRFVLTPAETSDLRHAVTTSGFFETAHQRPPPPDHAVWDLFVRLGARERRLRGLFEREARPLEAQLVRFFEQAFLTALLRADRLHDVRSALAHGAGRPLLRPNALGPEIAACAARLQDAVACSQAAAILAYLPSVDAWLGAARDLLPKLDGERRASVLGAWALEVDAPERADRRAAFRPLALAEVDASWSRWPSMTEVERRGWEHVLELLLEDRVARALEIAEGLTGIASTEDHPFVPRGLVGVGGEAVPVAARLLAARDVGARAAGVVVSRALLEGARGGSLGGRSPSAEERRAIDRRIGDELVPAIERCLADLAQPLALRKDCASFLDRWDGRMRAAREAVRADAEARRAAEAERHSTPTPPLLDGPLSIRGRLTAGEGTPLPGFGVFALRSDGSGRGATTDADGSFRISGLEAGTYDVFDTRTGEGLGRVRRKGTPAAKGVVAGTAESLDLRLPGTLIRGRLLEAEGRPARDRRVVATMRVPPSALEPAVGADAATTDAEGRFWLVRLAPGTYDVEVPGSPLLRGASGIEPGPEERTVEILAGEAISGRVVDETGVPLERVSVHATQALPEWHDPFQTALTGPDGRFRLDGLDPARRYRVVAGYGDSRGGGRSASVDDVAANTSALTLRIDTSPRIRFRLADGGRPIVSWHGIRLTRTGGGAPMERTFSGTRSVDWRLAPPGTWTVSVRVEDLDVRGATAWTWVDLGTVRAGDPERTFDVPK